MEELVVLKLLLPELVTCCKTRGFSNSVDIGFYHYLRMNYTVRLKSITRIAKSPDLAVKDARKEQR